ncbi:hypothetical protein HZC27_03365 [Candidatus Roizmanbacteria bacterium]|nr:hypothetical protein [Candidatus Roizmanbacteria bacterium]
MAKTTILGDIGLCVISNLGLLRRGASFYFRGETTGTMTLDPPDEPKRPGSIVKVLKDMNCVKEANSGEWNITIPSASIEDDYRNACIEERSGLKPCGECTFATATFIGYHESERAVCLIPTGVRQLSRK